MKMDHCQVDGMMENTPGSDRRPGSALGPGDAVPAAPASAQSQDLVRASLLPDGALKFNFTGFDRLASPASPTPRFRFGGFGKTAAGDGGAGGATGARLPERPTHSSAKVTVLAAARRPTCPLSRLPLELLFEVFSWAWQHGMRGPFRPHARPVPLSIHDAAHYATGCAGMAMAGEHLFIASRHSQGVVVLTRGGKLVHHMGAEEMRSRSGVAVAGDCLFAVNPTLRRVVVFRAADGALLRRFDTNMQPRGIAAADGLVFVSTDNHCVLVFREDGTAVRTIGQQGSGDGDLTSPSGVAVCDGELFVAETFNRRVSVFCADSGAFVRTIGWGKLTGPQDVCVGGGLLFVTTPAWPQHRVCVFSVADGRHVADLREGIGLGADAVCISDDGVLYVASQWGIVSFRVFGEGDAEAPSPAP